MATVQDGKKLYLRDLINIKEVQALADKFFAATKFPLSLLDEKGEVLVSSGGQKVCSDFLRRKIESCANCRRISLEGFDPAPEPDGTRKSYFEYRCENGLRHLAIPIQIEGQYLGACYLSQFFYPEDVPTSDATLAFSHQHGFQLEPYQQALKLVPVYSREQVQKIIEYDIQLVTLLTSLGLKTLQVQKAVEERVRAEESDKAKSLFLASMSHDIRTPMNSVLGMCEILFETKVNEEQKSYLQTLQFAGQTLLDLINTVLDIAKIESGTVEIIKDNFNLHSFLNNIHQVFLIQARKKKLGLILNVDKEVPVWIQEDSKRLKQILINLIGNAIKFTKEGRVTIDVTRDQGDLNFRVIDTGVGIADGDKEKVFEKFYQSHTDGQSAFGVGLGLTICKQLVDLMDGRIKIESEVGKGTTVSFSLPCKEIQAPPKIQMKEPEIELPMLPKNILLAEDVEDNRFIVSAFLKNTPWKVDFAIDGQEALEKLKANKYDLVLMDVQMPIMTGYEVVRAFRDWETQKGESYTPILALTANALSDDMQKSLEAGCDGHLAKPFRKRALISAVLAFTQS
jgi:signal transduction histidine kinase/ActR/RegA family two-component response regulator